MTKLIAALGAGVLTAAGIVAAVAVAGSSSPSPTVPTTGATTGIGSTSGDVSGPCDEAEHRNDPRCGGTPAATADDRRGGEDAGRGRGGDHAEDRARADAAEDVSGPCDEAEHRNDPRCGGTPGAAVDDRSGPSEAEDEAGDDHGGHGESGGGRGHDDHGGDDRRGSSSGRG